MNICVNCAAYRKSDMVKMRSDHRCAQGEVVDPVTGHTDQIDCAAMRAEKGQCGPEGTLFRPKLAGDECGQEVKG